MGRRFSFLRGADLAIDLGTANTLVYVRGEGIVVSEPSVVAIDSGVGDVVAVGDEAKRMIGRTPANISAIRPLRHGVIVDFDVTEEMLRYFIGKAPGGRGHPRLVLCVPSGLTGIEVSAVEEASLSAGAGEVHLIEEPIAAAIGAGLDIAQPTGRMVVDIGGGTTEVAVISLGGMVVQRSLPVGGYEFDEAIVNLLRREHGLSIGQPTAEALKLEIGSAYALGEELVSEVRGREVSTGLPRGVAMTSQSLRPALEAPVAAILAAVRDVLEETPPELASDIASNGILLAGGGSLLLGLVDRMHEETHMPTVRAETPLTCVAIGAGRSLEELDALSRGSRGSRRYALTSSYRRPSSRGGWVPDVPER
jgi:rod shape-determining protein MreB and related proteins